MKKNIKDIYIPDKVNIIGKASGYEKAPDNEFNIGINNIIWKKNCKIGFNMHRNIKNEYYKKAEKKGIILIHLGNYPIKDIIHAFKISFFESSLDFLLAFLAFKNVKEINIYGVHLSTTFEHIKQRPSFYYWLGFLKSKNIKININSKSLKISSNNFYGYFKTLNKINIL